MTRAHAVTQLLRLGPLSFRQIVEITGWQYRQARHTVDHLREKGVIYFNALVGGYAVSKENA